MKKINIDDIIVFLIKKMINTEVKNNSRGTDVMFTSAITGNVACTLYISCRDNIKVVRDVLEYLCEHESIFQEVKNAIEKYYTDFEPTMLYGDSTTIGEVLCCLNNIAEDIQRELVEEYIKNSEPHNPNIDYIEFVLTKLTRRDILEQLAEEASEVANTGNEISMSASFISQYAIKNIRATEDTENKTPEDIENINDQIQGNVSILNSTKNKALEEECGDLNMCLDLLYYLNGDHPIEEFNTLDNPKWKRWAERLGFISF